jgi:hypothetical protein
LRSNQPPPEARGGCLVAVAALRPQGVPRFVPQVGRFTQRARDTSCYHIVGATERVLDRRFEAHPTIKERDIHVDLVT